MLSIVGYLTSLSLCVGTRTTPKQAGLGPESWPTSSSRIIYLTISQSSSRSGLRFREAYEQERHSSVSWDFS